ncbi:MAG: serine/threonine-protein kinase [Massilia sp.]
MTAPDRIGPYTLLSPLAHGARSHAWRARDERSGAVAALKLARLGDAAACAGLRREFEVALLLGRHPHIVRILDYSEHDGVACLCMEQLSPPGALRLGEFGQLLRALEHVHACGMVHCDVKPANLLRAGGLLKLGDFGIARRPGAAGPAHGTPGYMAPEQMRARPLGPPADLYAAGVVLYELLAGTRPFAGSAFEMMQRALAGEVAPLAALPAGPGLHFAAIVQRALAPDPADRYQTAGQFLRDFCANMR